MVIKEGGEQKHTPSSYIPSHCRSQEEVISPLWKEYRGGLT